MSVRGHDLTDHQPHADEDRAEHGVEPLQGHSEPTCALRKLLSCSAVPAQTQLRPCSWPSFEIRRLLVLRDNPRRDAGQCITVGLPASVPSVSKAGGGMLKEFAGLLTLYLS
jgi:hypothetical protein